eukprot:scaffold1259_cov33-Tisochrysis_lutea.AAC.3
MEHSRRERGATGHHSAEPRIADFSGSKQHQRVECEQSKRGQRIRVAKLLTEQADKALVLLLQPLAIGLERLRATRLDAVTSRSCCFESDIGGQLPLRLLAARPDAHLASCSPCGKERTTCLGGGQSKRVVMGGERGVHKVEQLIRQPPVAQQTSLRLAHLLDGREAVRRRRRHGRGVHVVRKLVIVL